MGDVLAECKKLIDGYVQTIVTDIKSWRKKNTDLQHKYENTTLWMGMAIDMNQRMRDLVLRISGETRKSLELVYDCLCL
jgi:hypothetical protein